MPSFTDRGRCLEMQFPRSPFIIQANHRHRVEPERCFCQPKPALGTSSNYKTAVFRISTGPLPPPGCRSQQLYPRGGRAEPAAQQDSLRGISVPSLRTGRLGLLISEAKIILRFLLRNPHSKAWKMQRAQTETYFPCGYPDA